MSASPELAPVLRPAPAGPKLAPSPKPARGRRWLLLLLLLPIAAAGLLVRPRREATPAAFLVRTAKAFRGALRTSIRLNGTIESRHYVSILAPIVQAPDAGRGMVLTYLPPPGTMVKEGQVVAQLDPQAVKDHLDDVEATVDQGELDLRKLKAQQDEETEAVEQRVRVAKGNLDRALQDLRAAPSKNQIDQELLKLAVSEMQAFYEEAKSEVPVTAERQRANYRYSEMNQEYQVRHRNRHRVDIDHYTVHAPIGGLIVMKPIYRNGEQGQVQLGDQLAPGQLFMRIVDLSEMEVQASVNQAESELIHIGQVATVRFDAYPDLLLHGKVTAVGSLAVGGWRMNYFIRSIPVRISLEGRDPRIIPDSSASADVVVAEQDDTVIVPREAIAEEDGKSVVYVRREGAFSPREVEVGLRSNTEAAVVSGLQPGEDVALEPPHGLPE